MIYRTRTNTNPNGTEANAAGRSGNARALRKQSKCGMIQEGEGHWPSSSENLQKARNLWVLRTPQNNKEEGARAKKLVTCGTRGPLGRGQSVPFSAQGAYCSMTFQLLRIQYLMSSPPQILTIIAIFTLGKTTHHSLNFVLSQQLERISQFPMPVIWSQY